MFLFQRPKFLLFNFFVAVLVVSCSGEEVVQQETESDFSGDQAWVDSVFGELSEEQQYYQHLLIEVPAHYQLAIDSLVNWVVTNQPGALSFKGWNPDSVEQLRERIDTQMTLKPFFLADYFELIQTKPYPIWEANKSLLNPNFTSFFSRGGYNLIDFNLNISTRDQRVGEWVDSLVGAQEIWPVIAHFDDRDTAVNLDEFLNSITGAKSAVMIQLSRIDSVDFDAFRNSCQFEGLSLVRAKEQMTNFLLGKGVDFVFKRLETTESFTSWKPTESEHDLFAGSTQRILLSKSRLTKGQRRVNASKELKHIRLNMQANCTSLLRNEKKLLPFKNKFTVFSDGEIKLSQKVRQDVGVNFSQRAIDSESVAEIVKGKGNKVILVGDTCSEATLKELAKIKPEDQTLVAFSNPQDYEILQVCPDLLYYPSVQQFDAAIFVQQLSGRISLSGNFQGTDSLIVGLNLHKKLLARTDPEFCGLDADTLARISGLMNSCMNGHAFPGAQVLIAKDGCIVYDRAFGKHTYQGQTLVTENSMYDLASLTKVVATTMVGMKLFEMGVYEMDDSLGQYLPDSLKQHLKYPSTIRNITFQELFTHTSGLPAGFPIIKYMQYTSANVGRFDRYFCDRPDSVYMTEVAEGFYLEGEQQDSMWLRLNQIFLDPAKPYKYSDVNMNTLYFMFKSFIQKDPPKYGFTQPKRQLDGKNLFEEFLYNTYYKPLGMNHTCYRPLKRFNRDLIVPTENETYWRKQLLHGYVHDPNAALHGGVAGNAGIFSTTNDLVILLQMLLNEGVYNDQRYLKAETVDKFTSRQENCFRGLGFNKPSMGSTSFGMSENASLSTYGHTGFTGNCFWVDPEHGLIYIYLSNAVHPSVNNKNNEFGIRKKVHQCAYDAMMLKDF